LGRDARNIAIVEVASIEPDPQDSGSKRVNCRVRSILKGGLNDRTVDASYPGDSKLIPSMRELVIAFWNDRGNAFLLAPATPENLQQVGAGMAEGAVDLPEGY
jgi:hypothetical protein